MYLGHSWPQDYVAVGDSVLVVLSSMSALINTPRLDVFALLVYFKHAKVNQVFAATCEGLLSIYYY